MSGRPGSGGNGTGPGGNGTGPGGNGAGQLPSRSGASGPTAAPAGPIGPAGGRRPGGGPGMFGMGMGLPPAKTKDFRGSLIRLFGFLRPEAPRIAVGFAFGVVSVFFLVIGPRILSNAINVIFEGAISANLPAGATQQQVIDGARAAGQNQLADMLSGMTLTPGVGIDFGQLGSILLTMVGVYVASAIFS